MVLPLPGHPATPNQPTAAAAPHKRQLSASHPTGVSVAKRPRAASPLPTMLDSGGASMLSPHAASTAPHGAPSPALSAPSPAPVRAPSPLRQEVRPAPVPAPPKVELYNFLALREGVALAMSPAPVGVNGLEDMRTLDEVFSPGYQLYLRLCGGGQAGARTLPYVFTFTEFSFFIFELMFEAPELDPGRVTKPVFDRAFAKHIDSVPLSVELRALMNAIGAKAVPPGTFTPVGLPPTAPIAGTTQQGAILPQQGSSSSNQRGTSFQQAAIPQQGAPQAGFVNNLQPYTVNANGMAFSAPQAPLQVHPTQNPFHGVPLTTNPPNIPFYPVGHTNHLQRQTGQQVIHLQPAVGQQTTHLQLPTGHQQLHPAAQPVSYNAAPTTTESAELEAGLGLGVAGVRGEPTDVTGLNEDPHIAEAADAGDPRFAAATDASGVTEAAVGSDEHRTAEASVAGAHSNHAAATVAGGLAGADDPALSSRMPSLGIDAAWGECDEVGATLREEGTCQEDAGDVQVPTEDVEMADAGIPDGGPEGTTEPSWDEYLEFDDQPREGKSVEVEPTGAVEPAVEDVEMEESGRDEEHAPPGTAVVVDDYSQKVENCPQNNMPSTNQETDCVKSPERRLDVVDRNPEDVATDDRAGGLVEEEPTQSTEADHTSLAAPVVDVEAVAHDASGNVELEAAADGHHDGGQVDAGAGVPASVEAPDVVEVPTSVEDAAAVEAVISVVGPVDGEVATRTENDVATEDVGLKDNGSVDTGIAGPSSASPFAHPTRRNPPKPIDTARANRSAQLTQAADASLDKVSPDVDAALAMLELGTPRSTPRSIAKDRPRRSVASSPLSSPPSTPAPVAESSTGQRKVSRRKKNEPSEASSPMTLRTRSKAASSTVPATEPGTPKSARSRASKAAATASSPASSAASPGSRRSRRNADESNDADAASQPGSARTLRSSGPKSAPALNYHHLHHHGRST